MPLLLKKQGRRLSKNLFFDSLAEVTKAVKTSNSHSSAYIDTVEGELRSKSKPLRSKLFEVFVLS